MSVRNKWIWGAVSIVVAVFIMMEWLRNFHVSFQILATMFARLHWWTMVPLFALLAMHVALSSWRWTIIEGALCGTRPAFRPAFATGAMALGLGTFLPSPLINIAARGFANRVSGGNGLRGALSAGIDQIADLAAVTLMAIPAALAFVRHDLDIAIFGMVIIMPVGAGCLMAVPVILRSMRLPKWLGWSARMAPLANRSTLLKIYGISLLRVGNLVLLTLGIHFATDAATAAAVLVAVPLVTLAISAALLPGAIGISEWSFSAVFTGMGVERADIVMFVLANRIVLSGLSLLLAVLVLIVLANLALIRHRTAIA